MNNFEVTSKVEQLLDNLIIARGREATEGQLELYNNWETLLVLTHLLELFNENRELVTPEMF